LEATSLFLAEETGEEERVQIVGDMAFRRGRVIKATLVGSLALVFAASATFVFNNRGDFPKEAVPTRLLATNSVDGVRQLSESGAHNRTNSSRPETEMCAWLRVQGGKNKKCEGAHSSEAGSYQENANIPSAEECRILCLNNLDCKGIEYQHHTGVCRVWTEDIAGSSHELGTECDRCMRIPKPSTHDAFGNAFGDDFDLVDGAVNRACTTSHHHSAFHFSYNLVSVTSLEHCQELCMEFTTCRGIDYSERLGSCKEWEVDIDGSEEEAGHKCMRRKAYHFHAVNGGDDQACRHSNPQDDDPSYYKADYNTVTVKDCKILCLIDRDCHGMEWQEWDGRCELWTTDIWATEERHGFRCFRKTSFHGA
jgi:hypothetical protein